MSTPTQKIGCTSLNLEEVEKLTQVNTKLSLTDEATEKIKACRTYLDEKMAASSDPIYGINTGFGSLYKKNISKEDLERLQENLVKSHACGCGPEIPQEIVRLMLLLKVQSLAYGHSGTQLSTVQRLIDFYNEGIYPVVYEMGSLGASGDLAPLAHLSLPLIGEGEVYYEGKKYLAQEILQKFGWEPLHLKAKEGLALLNGTQFMSAWGVWALLHAQRVFKLATAVGTLSLEGFDGRPEPFDASIHQVRNQSGQQEVAELVRKLLEGSQLIQQPKRHVQDPYSFRCIPQVHGASLDTIRFVQNTFVNEINGVTDNPNVFPEEDKIISGGNFHGQPLALGLDYLAIALSELGNISERRTYQLVSGLRGLPEFLVADPGLNSGLMIPQYAAAALVSQNKQHCTPASIDSIVSSNGQEDHVSMGANAAVKLQRVVHNLYEILGIELLTAAQALHFRKPSKTSPILEEFLSNFRAVVSFVEVDRVLHHDIAKARDFLKKVTITW